MKETKRQFVYENISDRNIFTEKGRCKPGEEVKLYVDEAKKYKGLEKK